MIVGKMLLKLPQLWLVGLDRREVAQCDSVSSSVQRVQEGRCLEIAVKLSSAPYDCSFFLDSLCSLQKLGS